LALFDGKSNASQLFLWRSRLVATWVPIAGHLPNGAAVKSLARIDTIFAMIASLAFISLRPRQLLRRSISAPERGPLSTARPSFDLRQKNCGRAICREFLLCVERLSLLPGRRRRHLLARASGPAQASGGRSKRRTSSVVEPYRRWRPNSSRLLADRLARGRLGEGRASAPRGRERRARPPRRTAARTPR
jgi:hypothetical protein